MDAPRFLALDFETANIAADSACAIGLVRVEHGTITGSWSHLIRPPTRRFQFTGIHGLRWEDVENSPTWGDLWDEISAHFDGVDFLVAHNAGFDKRVLAACCAKHGIAFPSQPFVCTVQQARHTLNIRPSGLANVCLQLGISLNHHEALSDALACAKIMMEAQARRKARQAAQRASENEPSP